MSACPLCGAAGAPAFEKDGHAFDACVGCGTWYVTPTPSPESVAAFYRRLSGEAGSRLCWEGPATHAHALWDRALAEIRRRAGEGPVLDVGCGAGQFLAHARSRGLEALVGVEPSAQAAAAARQASGAEVHESGLEAAQLPLGRFAAVTLWDVLEHLTAPRAALAKAHRLLRPGGVVVVATPNRRGLSALAFGPRSKVVSPPEHLLVATRRGLAAALDAEGFEVARLDALELRVREWVRCGAADDAAPRSTQQAAYRLAYRRLTGLPGFAALHAGANAILSAARAGDQLLAIATRRGLRAGERGGT